MIKPFVFHFRLIRVVDGDTLFGNLDLGMRLTAEKEYIRLWGVDTPEIRGKNADMVKGPAATAFTADWLGGFPRPSFTVDSRQFNPLDSFARILGVVYRDNDPVSLNDALVAAGHAVRYPGS